MSICLGTGFSWPPSPSLYSALHTHSRRLKNIVGQLIRVGVIWQNIRDKVLGYMQVFSVRQSRNHGHWALLSRAYHTEIRRHVTLPLGTASMTISWHLQPVIFAEEMQSCFHLWHGEFISSGGLGCSPGKYTFKTY